MGIIVLKNYCSGKSYNILVVPYGMNILYKSKNEQAGLQFGKLYRLPARFLSGEGKMKKGDVVYNKFFGYGVIEEVSEKSCKIKFDSLKTIRTIKAGYFEKI